MDETFRVRLNCVDHYQASPTRLDPPLFGKYGSTQQRSAPQLPVIRVFGATETGQKVCAHIHGALPYLYLEYFGSLENQAVDAYIFSLRASIDHALAVSYRRNAYDGKAVYVGHITLVKGIPFFGYHVGYRYYLKIYILNPLNMTRFADLLYQGAIMKQTFQPFESHLQYLLQWMCDFNLYGCAYIDCKTVRFRDPVPDYLEINNTKHNWHERSIPQSAISDPTEFPRQSHCSIEVDICVEDIINRDEIQERNVHANFVERFGPLNPDEKLVHSLAGLWRDETMRRKRRMGISDPSSSPFPPEVLVSMSADPRNTDKGGWIHEEEYRDLVKELVFDENKVNPRKPTFDGFISPAPREDTIRTILESVSDLFHTTLMKEDSSFRYEPDMNGAIKDNVPMNAVVDESNIVDFDENDFPSDSDEENARNIAMTQKQLNVQKSQKTSDSVHGLFKDNAKDDAHESYQSGSRKRRKLSNGDDLPAIEQEIPEDNSMQRPPSRHVNFSDTSSGEPDLSQKSVTSMRGPESDALTSSQLSQGSIKAQGIGIRSSQSFAVVKNPRESMRTSSQGHSNKAEHHLKTPPYSTAPKRLQSPNTSWSDARTSTGTRSPVTPASKPSSQALSLASKYHGEFERRSSQAVFCFTQASPDFNTVAATLLDAGLPSIIYQDAYYSNERDVPERARDYGGREYKLESDTLPFLPPFDHTGTSAATYGAKAPILRDEAKEEQACELRRQRCMLRNWELLHTPPTWNEVNEWVNMEAQEATKQRREIKNRNAKGKIGSKTAFLSQIDGPTQNNEHGFKFSQKKKSTSVRYETQYMSTMSLEVHVNTRANLVPNPDEDEVACIFWCFKSDDEEMQDNGNLDGCRVGILVLSEDGSIPRRISKEFPFDIEHETNELDLINRMVDIVRAFDPDILTGYEVHNGSWGYLIERARIKFEYNLCDEFSRMKSQSHGRFGKDADRWGFNHTSTIRVTGRHMINIWRAMRSELNLLQYTMENVVFHVLHKRIPHYPFRDLTAWYKSDRSRDLAKCLEYFLSRVQINLEILEANELIPRTSEQARLIGVDFFSVFSRGSQFKVESFMFRIAKPENFVLVSPSRKQVGQQNALECLPLVMEPQSGFYNSPLLVLDFQSLYPSIMIAYNYCYSTCLGRVVGWRGQNKMGFADFKRQPKLLELVEENINIAPNGMMYVKPEMRKSLLAKMLGEILETRVMVKSGMKVDKHDKTLQQLLNNRQLALKLLANVTYGYTSASFSGRMPCAEIADSIVQTARETLEKAIALIHSNKQWGAEVVYGDTDSLFVYLKGRTKDQAFDIGNEIAEAITKVNPRPVKLKFEKVYFPCVLLAKKRYVGFKYESKSQKEPEFDAKGIETVRRDGTPAEQKIEEKALKILFRTADLSQVKRYFLHQCTKVMLGKVSIQDFCFAREVKLGTYADKGPPPPGAMISTRRMLEDPRAEPQYGERVPYVVSTGAPGARLIDRCVAPEKLLLEEGGELDAEYYISKNLIPPLERIFNLVGANVRQWFDEMPKVQRIRDVNTAPALPTYAANGAVVVARKTLESYMRSSNCVVCRIKLPPRPKGESDTVAHVPLCGSCIANPALSLYELRKRSRHAEKRLVELESVCRNCASLNCADEIKCDSKDCPVFYSRLRAKAREAKVTGIVENVSISLEKEIDSDIGW